MADKAYRTDISSPSIEELRNQQRANYDNPHGMLIASDRIEGTKVFRPDGESIGRVNHFMVNKRTGRAEFAILSFGGFLGLGEELRPVPWEALVYQPEYGGYVVSADDDTFRNSPFLEGGGAPEWDSAYTHRLFTYWGVPV